MKTHSPPRPRWSSRSGAKFLSIVLLALIALQGALATGDHLPAPGPVLSQGQHAPLPHSPCPEGPLTLRQCLQLAGQRQPSIAVARASLAAATERDHSLAALRVPTLVAPELPIRRQQSALGLTAASAAVAQAESETVCAVTRLWYAVQYAREQEKVARIAVDRIAATGKTARENLEGGSAEVTAADVGRSEAYERAAQARVVEAAEGVRRAVSALTEAIGVEGDCRVEVAAGGLFTPEAAPVLERVVALALSQRGELVRAGIFVEVAHLEADAQATRCGPRMQTFASGDIHSSPVPPGAFHSEYKPRAVAPEMPVLLIGHRSERVGQARVLQARAESALQKARNLITLEAEDAVLRLRQSQRQAKLATRAAAAAEKLADQLEKDLGAGLRVKVEEVLNMRLVAAQSRSQENEALFRQILALADLERITAGAFRANLMGPPAAPAPAKEGKEEKKADKPGPG
jgi:outer membrane protein TolC